jgi:hypothetical protein
MRVVTRYRCEICDEDYASIDEAAACEARGRAEVPSWLRRVVAEGFVVYGWGEQGICGYGADVKIARVLVAHTIKVELTKPLRNVSHNYDGDGWTHHLDTIDPMAGYDFLRYVDPDAGRLATIWIWIDCCRLWGIEPDPEKARWAKERPWFVELVKTALAKAKPS